MEIFFSFIEAEETVINLLEDRGKLQEQLEILRSNPETVGSEECKNLEEDIECRSAQISDFQNKIMESDDGTTPLYILTQIGGNFVGLL